MDPETHAKDLQWRVRDRSVPQSVRSDKLWPMTRLAIILLLLSLMGCASSLPSSSNPMTVDAREYARLFDASVEVLRDRGFRIDRQDFRFGTVTSKPDGSPTLLEPWRGDNHTVALAGWSTLSDLRRVVTVTLEPQSDTPEQSLYDLSVVVELQREQSPLRRLDGNSSKGQFRSLNEVPEEWARRGVTAKSWETVGRDEAMEQALLHAIVDRAMETDA